MLGIPTAILKTILIRLNVTPLIHTRPTEKQPCIGAAFSMMTSRLRFHLKSRLFYACRITRNCPRVRHTGDNTCSHGCCDNGVEHDRCHGSHTVYNVRQGRWTEHGSFPYITSFQYLINYTQCQTSSRKLSKSWATTRTCQVMQTSTLPLGLREGMQKRATVSDSIIIGWPT